MKHHHPKTQRNILVTAIATAALGAAPAFAGGDATDWEGEMKDAWLDGKIETSYTLNRYLNPFEIDTDVENGVVMLSGTVESEIDRDLAEEIARGTDGVREVKNELLVAEREGDWERESASAVDAFEQNFTDATTTARVKFALLANDSTEGLSIDVDTDGGVVTLSGEVESDQAMELAERIASNAEGVQSVENRLQVASSS